MVRSLFCLALLALVAAAAAAPLPSYKCTGKINNPDPSGPKTLPYVEWTATLSGMDGKSAGTMKICWNRQGLSNSSIANGTSTAEFQWAVVINNVQAYYALGLGVGLAPPTNGLVVGMLGQPTPTLLRKADMFGVLPKSLYTDPALAGFVKAGCVPDAKKMTQAAVAVWAYTNGTVPAQFTATQFKLNKGACSPALP